MSDPAMEFSIKIDRFAKDMLPRKRNDFIRRIALGLFSKVIYKTPVDTGRARGNWQCTLGDPARSVVGNLDKVGAPTVSSADGTIKAARPGEVIWLSNNLPYIGRLENGWSKQSPYGMVKISLAEIEARFQ